MVQSTGIVSITGDKQVELAQDHQDSFSVDTMKFTEPIISWSLISTLNFIPKDIVFQYSNSKPIKAYEWATQDPADPSKIVFIGDESMGFGFSTLDTSTATIV